MKRIDKAIEIFNAGFTSKSSKKNALSLINSDYDDERDSIMNEILDYRNDYEPSSEGYKLYHELYWDVPSYPHLWKEKHSNIYKEICLEEVENIEILVELRNSIFEAPVNKPVKSDVEVKAKVIVEDIKCILEKRKESYLRGLDLSEKFGGLSVYANAHLVTNSYGTTFVRHFFYMFGKLTALNVIIAVAQKLEDEGK